MQVRLGHSDILPQYCIQVIVCSSKVPGKKEKEAERFYSQDKVLHDTGYDGMIALGYAQKVSFLQEIQERNQFRTACGKITPRSYLR